MLSTNARTPVTLLYSDLPFIASYKFSCCSPVLNEGICFHGATSLISLITLLSLHIKIFFKKEKHLFFVFFLLLPFLFQCPNRCLWAKSEWSSKCLYGFWHLIVSFLLYLISVSRICNDKTNPYLYKIQGNLTAPVRPHASLGQRGGDGERWHAFVCCLYSWLNLPSCLNTAEQRQANVIHMTGCVVTF